MRNREVDRIYKVYMKYNPDLNRKIMDRYFKHDNDIYIMRNVFPYDLDNRKHWLLWIRPNVEVDVDKIVKDKFGNVEYKENDKDKRSVSKITHYHIFY